MKIFNWVQRKFSNNKENAENNKNNGGKISVIGDHDHQLWSGGILTIGTFGFDPLIDIHEEKNDHFHHEEVVDHYDQMNIASDIISNEKDEEVDQHYVEDGEEEEKPFVFTAYDEHESEDGNNNYNNKKREFEYEMMEKKERITLADLFIADHEDHKEKPLMNNVVNMGKGGIIITKEKANRKHGFSSYAKKLAVDEARPIRKLNQIVRRIMRRKIHPGVISSKVSVGKYEVNDDASLLPTHQDM